MSSSYYKVGGLFSLICKDGFSAMPAAGYSNYFGVVKVNQESAKSVTNTSERGGWFMISGVELGNNKMMTYQVEVFDKLCRDL